MKRRRFIQNLSSMGMAAALGASPALAQTKKPKNILFILVDDLGWTDLTCFGSSFYETPNIDRLRRSGMKFNQAYAACPVCSPTRASIMTGKYPARVGITDYINPGRANQPENWKRNTKLMPAPYRDRLPLEEVTLAEELKKHGYATFFAGKWHLGVEGFYPENQGFDINKGGIERGGPYGGNKYFSPYGNPRLKDGPEGEHLPARLGMETAKFIEANRDKPFLAYLAFYSVHTPLMAREDLKEKYEAKAKTLPKREVWAKEGKSKLRIVQNHAVFAGMVEAMDAAVGHVLDTLDRLGLADDTIVMFMSDNGGLATSEGWPTSNLPLRAGKGWMYEGGIREPMIVRVPGMTEPNSECNDYITSTDFYPTILDLLDFPKNESQHVDGKSFLTLLEGGSMKRGPIFWHYPHYGNQGGAPSGAVRDGDYKLIEWYEDDRLELFNLASDIGEHRNLAESEPERAKTMQRQLHAWRDSLNASMPVRNANYKER